MDGNLSGWIWLFVFLHRITFVRNWERVWTVVFLCLSCIAIGFAWEVYTDPNNVISGYRVAFVGYSFN